MVRYHRFLIGSRHSAFYFFPHADGAKRAADASTIVRVVVFVFYGLLLAIGMWWLILFNRKEVMSQFSAAAIVNGALASTGQRLNVQDLLRPFLWRFF